jgi:hypothetical protein
MSWYKKGVEEVRKSITQDEAQAALRAETGYVFKFYLKPETEAKVIFVDDEGFYCNVHTVQINGRWQTLTCTEGIRPCPICQQTGKKGSGTVYFTVIDTRPYVAKDGTTHKMTKALLPAKRQLAKQLLDIKDKVGSLVGMSFTLKRYGSKDAASGIVLDYDKDKIYKLKDDWAVPYDYEKILRPLTDEELEALGFTALKVVGDTVDPIGSLDLETEEATTTTTTENDESDILSSLEDVLSEDDSSPSEDDDDLPF